MRVCAIFPSLAIPAAIVCVDNVRDDGAVAANFTLHAFGESGVGTKRLGPCVWLPSSPEFACLGGRLIVLCVENVCYGQWLSDKDGAPGEPWRVAGRWEPIKVPREILALSAVSMVSDGKSLAIFGNVERGAPNGAEIADAIMFRAIIVGNDMRIVDRMVTPGGQIPPSITQYIPLGSAGFAVCDCDGDDDRGKIHYYLRANSRYAKRTTIVICDIDYMPDFLAISPRGDVTILGTCQRGSTMQGITAEQIYQGVNSGLDGERGYYPTIVELPEPVIEYAQSADCDSYGRAYVINGRPASRTRPVREINLSVIDVARRKTIGISGIIGPKK